MKKVIYKTLDISLLPFVYFSAWLLKAVRKKGVHRLPYIKRALFQVGVFPIRNHYYEPQFDFRAPHKEFSLDRSLPGIKINKEMQLAYLEKYSFSKELENISIDKVDELDFYLNNGSFGPGDAEYWYQVVRSTKPKRIIEIGSGNSTLMAIKAIEQNQTEDSSYTCEHTCIEPYEMPWLEKTSVSVLREKVEEVDVEFFSQLEENDILFIDSSHVIRPQGDVLFEYLELLPTLKKGVIVHVHDIFLPKNYSKAWLEDKVTFWNEQYLLEAFLSHNDSWEIIGALNYLSHNHFDDLKRVTPFLTPAHEPGSFYMKKTA
ncbi:MAG: class I SAM-dependent methyltransferase [Gammaproteobacteria bacterium]|jgi:hypothetical protein|nr:class I SAM-dependent methyltransferase [Gammaproteobacteria bacterium]